MTKSRFGISANLLALALACAVTMLHPGTAAAQQATDLRCNGCVEGKDLKNGGVTAKDLKKRAVTSKKIKPGAVTSGAIADGQVGNADLGADAVTADKIQDGSVSNADLGGERREQRQCRRRKPHGRRPRGGLGGLERGCGREHSRDRSLQRSRSGLRRR